ncbi:MAG: hypothetical protein JST22_04675 [Bacteroidetes bacterium]|nr:hypothetical protein [Bacteroidota bacterium]
MPIVPQRKFSIETTLTPEAARSALRELLDAGELPAGSGRPMEVNGNVDGHILQINLLAYRPSRSSFSRRPQFGTYFVELRGHVEPRPHGSAVVGSIAPDATMTLSIVTGLLPAILFATVSAIGIFANVVAVIPGVFALASFLQWRYFRSKAMAAIVNLYASVESVLQAASNGNRRSNG